MPATNFHKAPLAFLAALSLHIPALHIPALLIPALLIPGGLAFAAPPSPVKGPGLQAAAVKVDITPDNLHNLNPFNGGSFEGVHDPIFARVLLLSSGGRSALIVTIDTPEVGDMVPFRKRIEREAGIAFDHIILAATHDHSAPRIGDLSPGTRAQKASPDMLAYSETVYDRILSAIRTAKAALRPARMGYGRGRVDINVNRDAYVPGKGWTQGYNPDGDSDEGLPVVRFDGVDGKPIAVLFTYGVHSTATFGIGQVSGDLAGAAERHVETFGGDGVVGMFMMGPAGDQNPIVTQGRPRPEDPKFRDLAFRAMDAQGLVLGAEALRVAGAIQMTDDDVHILAANRDLTCPTKETTAQMGTMSIAQSPHVVIRLSALMLNDIAIGGVGGEVTTPIYRRLMRQTPFTRTIFATNVNDRIGYIVNDAAYDSPTFEVNGSPVARGCAEAGIADELTRIFSELRP